MAIVRTARRLRQEAAAETSGLTPTSVAALATIERHGPLTPSELAEIERVKRPTITRTLGCLEREGLIDRDPRPGRRAQRPGQRQRRRPRAAAAPARPQERLPGAPHARAPAEDVETLERAAEILDRMREGERVLSGRAAPLLQLARGPQLPALLRRPADLPLRHLDADGGGDLADPQPHRQRRRGRPDHGAAVPADAADRRLGRPARRPLPEAPPADRRPRR